MARREERINLFMQHAFLPFASLIPQNLSSITPTIHSESYKKNKGTGASNPPIKLYPLFSRTFRREIRINPLTSFHPTFPTSSFFKETDSLKGKRDREKSCLVLIRPSGTLGCAGLESVLEFPVDSLQVSHSSCTGGLASHGLLAPVD